jgi:hypothetical protein
VNCKICKISSKEENEMVICSLPKNIFICGNCAQTLAYYFLNLMTNNIIVLQTPTYMQSLDEPKD